ncbi:hypothetical protein KY284_011028 [Solanum tuberosum]|nr:hypothetical protein KY284_011028 [Solanum tuberosum]
MHSTNSYVLSRLSHPVPFRSVPVPSRYIVGRDGTEPSIRPDNSRPVHFGTGQKTDQTVLLRSGGSVLIRCAALAGTSAAIAGTNAATSNVAAGTNAASVGNVATSDFTNAAIGSQSSVNAGPSAGLSARRPTNASSSGVRPATALASGGRPTSATSSDVRQLSTQQSTFSEAGQKRKTSTALRGGATLAYKRPREKKEAKTAGYGLLFGSGGSVTERSGNTDRVLDSATLPSSTPTNIDLGYKPNGLRWKGRAAITQRQLQEESYKALKAHIRFHFV